MSLIYTPSFCASSSMLERHREHKIEEPVVGIAAFAFLLLRNFISFRVSFEGSVCWKCSATTAQARFPGKPLTNSCTDSFSWSILDQRNDHVVKSALVAWWINDQRLIAFLIIRLDSLLSFIGFFPNNHLQKLVSSEYFAMRHSLSITGINMYVALLCHVWDMWKE